MQEGKIRRSQKQRSETTRSALIAAARRLFVENGYAATGTPEIVAAAGVTRGALYHHFTDKADLFRAVVEAEWQAVATVIEAETAEPGSGVEALMAGSDAYFAAMAVEGRARLLLVEGPSVLGQAEIDRIDAATGGAELREGLAHAMAGRSGMPLDALAEVLSAAFDRAALAISRGGPAGDYRVAMRLVLEGLLRTR